MAHDPAQLIVEQLEQGMSFKVDTEALRQFADCLGDSGYAGDAYWVKDFFADKTELGAHEGGLLDMLIGGHANVVAGMRERTSLMEQIGLGSATAVGSAAIFYDDMDETEAAELDATYDSVSGERAELPDASGSGASFDYQSAKGELDIDKKPEDLQPKMSKVEEWYRWLVDGASPTATVRSVIEYACGVDPINWLSELFIGEWTAWARCALAWDACDDAVTEMAANVDPMLSTLRGVWEGKAADLALDYFAKLRDATTTEAEAFAALYAAYKLWVEYIYECQLVINDILNTIIDLALDIAFAIGGSIYGLLGADEAALLDALLAIWDLFTELGIVITAIIDAIKIFETVAAAFDLPEVPPCELTELPGRQGKNLPPTYEHPGARY